MNYVIKASELYQKAKEILNDGMDYVCISLLEEDDTDPDDILPPAVHFQAFTRENKSGWVDYEDVEVVPTSDI